MRIKNGVRIGITALVAGLLLAPVSGSFAQPGGPGPCGMGFLERWDEDGDGRISQDEFPNPEKRFARLDANKDGAIDASEMPGPMGGPGRRWDTRFESLDKNKDGKLSKDEAPNLRQDFTRFDLDGDGFLEKSELPPGPPRHGRGMGNWLQDFDKDGDGKLSKDEFPNPENCFARMDSNNDGFIDPSEMPRGPRHRGRGWRN